MLVVLLFLSTIVLEGAAAGSPLTAQTSGGPQKADGWACSLQLGHKSSAPVFTTCRYA